jgi:hypothetical protein
LNFTSFKFASVIEVLTINDVFVVVVAFADVGEVKSTSGKIVSTVKVLKAVEFTSSDEFIANV